MKRFWLGIALFASFVLPAKAQNITGYVVPTCGSVSPSYVAGRSGAYTVDVNGNLCTGGAGASSSTLNRSAIIVTGLTYQVVVPAGTYKSILIENNNTNTDLCYVEDTGLVVATNTTSTSVTPTGGVSMAASKASITLAVNGSYNLPSGGTVAAIVATCASTNDWLYVRTQ